MTLIHRTGTGIEIGPILSVSALLGVVLVVHLTRALATSTSSAQRWAAKRSLALGPRTLGEVEQHLRRLHWGRFLGTAVLGAVSLTLALLSRPTISFVSLPLLLGVFVAELLVPAPRRGRVRSVVLQRRSSSYFAPAAALRVTRVLLVASVLLGGWGVLLDAGGVRASMIRTHVLALIIGFAVLELSLRQLTSRGLPDRSDDIALDCAIRVADARALTAAGLVFATIGFVLAAIPALQALGSPGSTLFSVVVPIAVPALCVWALTLTQPLQAWRPA
jgi:hypothetical protein